MKTLQAALTDELAAGTITIDIWLVKDQAYSQAIARIQARLDAAGWDPNQTVSTMTTTQSINARSVSNEQLVLNSINTLSGMGEDYEEAIEISRERVDGGYY